MTPELILQLTQVRRTFPTPGGAIDVLRSVDLIVRRGDLVAVAGPSGSGKTTLLNLAGGLDHPDNGQVALFGCRLDQCTATERVALQQRVGFLFQSFALLASHTAYEQVELPLRLTGHLPRHSWDERVQSSLQDVGLDAWRDHRPFEMSGGQQQRVALARALVHRPALLLADEPTGHLDTATARRIWELLRTCCIEYNMAILIATHDPLVAAVATQRYVLEDGTLYAA